MRRLSNRYLGKWNRFKTAIKCVRIVDVHVCGFILQTTIGSNLLANAKKVRPKSDTNIGKRCFADWPIEILLKRPSCECVNAKTAFKKNVKTIRKFIVGCHFMGHFILLLLLNCSVVFVRISSRALFCISKRWKWQRAIAWNIVSNAKRCFCFRRKFTLLSRRERERECLVYNFELVTNTNSAPVRSTVNISQNVRMWIFFGYYLFAHIIHSHSTFRLGLHLFSCATPKHKPSHIFDQ